MNKAIVTMILFATVNCALAATNENGQKDPATPATAQAVTLPKEAVGNPDGTYLWVDKQGKSWIYRKTAGGYVRSAAPPIPSHAATIPKDAVANPDGSYVWTDKEGKKWAFFNTPFGVVKNPVTESATPAAGATDTKTKVIDKGNTVRFERPTPFGVSAYEKPKSELNDDERRLYEASQAKPE